jgi:hypothetical protein
MYMKKRLLAILAVVAMVLALVIPMGTPVLAGPPNPPNANSNDLALQLSVVPNLTYNGATVVYHLSISNPINPDPNLHTAYASNIIVKFFPPTSNGTPAVTPSIIFPAFDLAPGGAPVVLAPQSVTLALDPGVSIAFGEASFSATLFTFPVDSLVTGDKNIPLTIIHPSTTVAITPSPTTVLAGGTVSLTVTEHNNDTIGALTGVNVVVSSVPGTTTPAMPLTLLHSSAYLTSDGNGDAILDGGETWTWIVTGVVVNANTTFTANGDGIDLLNNHVNVNTVGGTTPGVQTEQAPTTVNLIPPGALTITKAVDLGSVVDPTGITQDFVINVIGPSWPSPGTNLTFHLLNGVLQAPTSVTLSNLNPGTYTVTETSPGPNWTVSGTGGVAVSSGGTGTATVTNTYKPGSLVITKAVIGAGTQTKDFVVTVVGPSYPTPGTSHTFHLVGGVISAPWVLSNLIPGSYTVSEASPGPGWTASGGGGVTVNSAGASTTITNTYAQPSTLLTMSSSVTGNILPVGGGDVILTIVETNTGATPLVGPSSSPPTPLPPSPYVALNGGSFVTPSPMILTNVSVAPNVVFSRNAGAPGSNIMGIGEIWTWTVTIQNVTSATTFQATGHGFDPQGLDVTYPASPEQASVSITLTPPVPGLSNLGIWLLVGGFAAAMALFVSRRARRSPQKS